MIVCEQKFLESLQEKLKDESFLTFDCIEEFLKAKHTVAPLDEIIHIQFQIDGQTKEDALRTTKKYLNTILKLVKVRKHNVHLYAILEGPFIGEINEALEYYCTKVYNWTFEDPSKIHVELQPNNYNIAETFHIVASFYNENEKWLLPYNKNVIVYNKGPKVLSSKFNAFPVVYEVPNVGRESETYLQYIIAYYDKLPNVVLFTQGHVLDHVSQETLLCSILRAYTNNGYAAPENLKGTTNWSKIDHGGKYLQALKTGKMFKVDYTLGQFFEKIFPSRKLPLQCVYYRCGLFACTKECILQHPKEFYENAYSLIPHHMDPEVGHYFERIWYYMFNEKNGWTYKV